MLYTGACDVIMLFNRWVYIGGAFLPLVLAWQAVIFAPKK